MTIQAAFNKISQQLRAYGLSEVNAEQEAWWIIQSITSQPQATLLLMFETNLSEEEEKKLEQILNDRIVHSKPLQYSIGTVPFCSLSIKVKPPTLIPRPETEEWCSELISRLQKREPQQLTILDLCTGSGCIALALAAAFPRATVIGIDIKPDAIALANENKEYNALTNVTFILSNLFEKITGIFDIIVSNPPYLSSAEWDNLSLDVQKWEDKDALIADNNGLAFYYEIIDKAPLYLRENPSFISQEIPSLVFEINPLLVSELQKKMSKSAFKRKEIHYDLAGKPRALFMYS